MDEIELVAAECEHYRLFVCYDDKYYMVDDNEGSYPYITYVGSSLYNFDDLEYADSRDLRRFNNMKNKLTKMIRRGYYDYN